MIDHVRPTLQLAEPVQIPEQYTETCLAFLAHYWQGRKWEMQENFGFHQLAMLSPDDLQRTILAETLATIARAAAGEFDRDNESLAGEVYECLQGLMETLFSTPGLGGSYLIPDTFYDSPLGQMVGRAWLWLRHDELITIAEAAKLKNVSVQAISQAINDGRLRAYFNPDAKQRQGRRLVSRQQVDELEMN